MTLELLGDLRARYGTTATPVLADPDQGRPGGELEPERAFVVDQRGSDGKLRTIITGPLREIARANQGFTYLRGRFVEADTPNGNGAMWTSEDLQMAEATVAGGPLNWLHQETKIIGTLLDGQMVAGREQSAAGAAIGNHIVSNAVMWRFLFPNETRAIETAAANSNAFFSMECLSRAVACVDTPGRPGCGEEFPYEDYDAGRTCAHLSERTSVRRFVDPWFLGGAVIVPPVQPGWANANVEVMRQAAELQERQAAGADHLETAEAREMVAQILQWAAR